MSSPIYSELRKRQLRRRIDEPRPGAPRRITDVVVEKVITDRLKAGAENYASVIVIEYEVNGRVVGSGAAYENRFVSIVTVENRQIVHWRDYMDSLAAVRALSTKTGRLA